MGRGKYSFSDRDVRASKLGYDTKSAQEIFTQRSINNAMDPNGVDIRESRDSEEHPNSIAIAIALDVTGSMGSVPHHLVKKGMPDIMEKMIAKGIKDPQILFLAIGDHKCDKAPLQVGQFESSDELMDKWLTSVYLEGGGGANEGESYFLAWYFAARHTSIDCFEKRGQKGFLFTIGDEPTLKSISGGSLKNIMGPGDEYGDIKYTDVLAKAREKYNVYHIHIHQTRAGQIENTIEGWKELMGENLIIAEQKEDVPGIISEVILNHSFSMPDPILPYSVYAKENSLNDSTIDYTIML